MKFHGVEMVGPFWLQQVSTVPAWTAADMGRLIFCQFDNKTYYASASAWVEVSVGTHTHDYLGSTAQAADSDKLDGNHGSYFSPTTHAHTGTYLPLAGQAADSDKVDGYHASSLAMLAGGNTFTGTQVFSDGVIQRPELKDYSETFVDAGTGSNYTFNLENGNNFQRVVNATSTFTFSNPPATTKVGSISLFLINGASFTINWPSSVKWPNNTIPTLGANTTSLVDVLTFVTFNAGTRWYGNLAISKLPI